MPLSLTLSLSPSLYASGMFVIYAIIFHQNRMCVRQIIAFPTILMHVEYVVAVQLLVGWQPKQEHQLQWQRLLGRSKMTTTDVVHMANDSY